MGYMKYKVSFAVRSLVRFLYVSVVMFSAVSLAGECKVAIKNTFSFCYEGETSRCLNNVTISGYDVSLLKSKFDKVVAVDQHQFDRKKNQQSPYAMSFNVEFFSEGNPALEIKLYHLQANIYRYEGGKYVYKYTRKQLISDGDLENDQSMIDALNELLKKVRKAKDC